MSHESSLNEGSNTLIQGTQKNSPTHVKTQAEDGCLCFLLTDAGCASSLSLNHIISRSATECVCSIQEPLSLWSSVTVARQG